MDKQSTSYQPSANNLKVTNMEHNDKHDLI